MHPVKMPHYEGESYKGLISALEVTCTLHSQSILHMLFNIQQRLKHQIAVQGYGEFIGLMAKMSQFQTMAGPAAKSFNKNPNAPANITLYISAHKQNKRKLL